MTPTPEQSAILTSDPLPITKVLAYAGTGKTSTLCALAEQTPSDVLYLAFNKSVEVDASMRFPCNTTCKTGHALAWKHVGHKYTNIANLYNWQLSKAYSLTLYEASLLLRSYEAFCNSAEPCPAIVHVEPDILNRFNPALYTEGMVERMEQLWSDMVGQRNGIPMTHSGYLKLFALGRPKLGFPLVLLDEAQDTNPVMLRLVLDQMESGSRVIMVGDPYQQIYSWRGALDAMASIEAPEFRLTQSFRFGPEIAEVASRILRLCFDEKVPLSGLRPPDPYLGSEQMTVICRTNAGVVREAYLAAKGEATINVNGEIAFRGALSKLDDIYLLSRNQHSMIAEKRIARFKDISALKVYAEEAFDVELGVHLSIIEKWGSDWPGMKESILSAITPQDKADVILTTTHKAKGLEWNVVKICSDFKDLTLPRWNDKTQEMDVVVKDVVRKKQPEESEVHAEEVNLLYVAATRAKQSLIQTMDMQRLAKVGVEEVV